MKFLNTATNETVEFTEAQIIEEINRDRSEEWVDYTDDWRDGLSLTEYELIEDDPEDKIVTALIQSGLIYRDKDGNYRVGIDGDSDANDAVHDIVRDLTK